MDADGSFLRFWEATGQSMKHTDCKMEVSPIWPRNGTTLAGLAAFWVGSYSDLTHLVAKNWKNTEKTYQHVHWRSLAKTSWYNLQPTWSWFKWHIPRHFSGLVFEARRCGTGLGRGSHLHPRGFEGGNWCDVTPDDNSAGGGSDHFSPSNLKKNGCNLPCDFAPWRTGCATTTSSRFWACVFSRFWSFHILLTIDVPDILILAIDSHFLWQLSHFWSWFDDVRCILLCMFIVILSHSFSSFFPIILKYLKRTPCSVCGSFWHPSHEDNVPYHSGELNTTPFLECGF